MHPAGHPLSERNVGTLRQDRDDPRVKDFVEGLAIVNAVAEHGPGFVWRPADAATELEPTAAAGAFGANPRGAATLSVWTAAGALGQFVWNTAHRHFYARRAKWYDMRGKANHVLWWVPRSHNPSVAKGLVRHRRPLPDGLTAEAFGCDWVKPTLALGKGL